MAGGMAPYSDLRDLRQALAELAGRGKPSYPVCCLLLWAGEHGLDLAVERYVLGEWDHLDALTGDDVLVFAIDSRREGRRRWTPEVAKHLGVKLDAVPCAVFFVPGTDESHLRVVLRLSRYIPLGDAGYDEGDVATAFRAIAQAACDCRGEPSEQRLACLKETLKAAHKRSFPGRAGQPSAVEELRSNLTVAASVSGVLIQLATKLMGLP